MDGLATGDGTKLLSELNDRSREVFRRVVEGYLASGDPVGSRTLTRTMTERLSAATIRNVMQDLEFLGLLDSPHVSAGRIPTQRGLRLFVDGLLEVGSVNSEDRDVMDAALTSGEQDVTSLLDHVSATLSGITRGASVVLAPKQEAPIRHIEFVGLSPDRALVVLVFANGQVENRIFNPPPGQTAASMREAANFLNSLAEGRTLSELRRTMAAEIARRRQEVDSLARDLVESGLAVWENPGEQAERLIVRGRANLLEDAKAAEDLDRVRQLFNELERQQSLLEVLDTTRDASGVRLFIGSENRLFPLSGSSVIVAPYMGGTKQVIGALGVIGPTRLNYARVIPMVDYTAKVVGEILAGRRGKDGK
ncbi:MAG TPA: heat-inducible transcriptional repressor HrcA [Hyphomonas sp.]|nr:heat-inducible transcriptional repressor HrcA [Hyphomonas sp.]